MTNDMSNLEGQGLGSENLTSNRIDVSKSNKPISNMIDIPTRNKQFVV